MYSSRRWTRYALLTSWPVMFKMRHNGHVIWRPELWRAGGRLDAVRAE
jgi:hypothetical protein